MSRPSYAVHRVPRDNTGMNSAPGTANGPRRTKPRGRHPDKALSALFVRTAGPGRYCDGQGLYLFVQPSGTRSWVQRLVVRGRHQELGLGSAQLVPLAEAREEGAGQPQTGPRGRPTRSRRNAARRRRRRSPTPPRRVLDQQRAGWQSSRHPQSWLASLERYAFPRIGTRLISDVTSADVLAILTPIWHDKAQTARRVRPAPPGGVGVGRGDGVADRQPLRPYRPGPRPAAGAGWRTGRALPHQDVAAAVAAVRMSAAAPGVTLACEWLVLTAARWGEVRGAEWAEMDTAGRVWMIPATRMKAKRPHRVPLARRAMAILDAARTLGDGTSPLVFPAAGGTPLPEQALRRLLQDQQIAAVPHGFRSTFRDWAAEDTDHPREVIEAALAHMVHNQVEAAYARSDLFERRRRLMDDWAKYVGG